MKYKTILFDFDGTVFDTVEGITKSIQYAIRKRGMDAPLDKLRCFAGPPLVAKFIEVYGVSEEDARQMVTDFRERYVPVGVYESRPFPGIGELLQILKERGVTTGIATSKPQEMAELLLERASLKESFDVISGSRPDIGNDSKAQVLRYAMNLCGADPEHTVLVGDTKYDVAGAKECGIPCIGVRWGYAAENELEQADAEYIAETMDELLMYVTETRN